MLLLQYRVKILLQFTIAICVHCTVDSTLCSLCIFISVVSEGAV